ncbi:MAG: HAD family hydrolase [Fervidicoccaceae archaeon]
MKIKAVLFDFDGTVIDTMKEYAEMAAEIISKEIGIEKKEAKRVYLSTAGRDFLSQLRLMGIEGERALKIYSEFLEEKKKILNSKEISHHAVELMKELKRKGMIVAVSTNNECELVFSIPGINNFDEVLCFDKKQFKKGTAHLSALMLKYHLKKEEILFIGDSDYDIETYSQLGIKCLKTKGIFNEREADRILEEIESERLE